MNVLMIGVDKKILGGMWTVVENYIENKDFCKKTNLIYIPTAGTGLVICKILFFIKSLIKIIFTIMYKKIDIIHIHMAEKGSVFREGLIVLIGRFFKCKTIIHMHGATIEDWYNRQNSFVQKIVSTIFNNADKIFVLGYIWKGFMKRIVNDESKVEVVYNAVNVPGKILYNNEAKEIIFLGVLIQRKGIYDLLKAISKIKKDLPKDIKVKLYGSDKNNNISTEIKKMDLEDIVEYCGWLNNIKKNECFKKTLINILPSYNEGLPMTILETMSYGIPNITTNIAAIPEAVRNNEDGILINPGDVNALSDSILNLVKNSDIRKSYSENSYKRAKEEFDIKHHLEKVYRIYCNLIYS